MSILIRGMEMPTSCVECGFKINCDDCEGHECFCAVLHRSIGYMPYNSDFYKEDVSLVLSDSRLDDCPLITVPPHGDLIDRDALHFSRVQLVHPSGNVGGYNAVVMSAEIKDAPAIIPSEEEK